MEDDSGLSLGLGVGGYVPKKEKQKVNTPMPFLDLTFDLSPKVESTIELDHEGLNNTNENGSRKKLRLTKEQYTVLEKTFRLHSTLNPVQKQALAEQLNLKNRQVEVWFQNRRARTKLKQTEVDCEFLKKCCEKLTEENLRLKKELQELRSFKIGPSPLYIHLSKATTLTICSSCEELVKKKHNEGNNIAANISNLVKLKSSVEL